MTQPVQENELAVLPPIPSAKTETPATADAEVRQVVQRFADAYMDRSTAALKMIHPGLTDSELAALDRTFVMSSEYRFTPTDLKVQVSGEVAKVMCRISRRIVPLTGEARNMSGTGEFDLMRSSGGWMITRAVIR